MSFQPILPFGGYTGWRFLQRTQEKQATAHASAAAQKREEEYFRDKIASVPSAEALVSDRRLLSVSLTAFGLQDDLANRAYLRKVLESSIYDSGSFVNRLSHKRYRQLSEAFGFGDRLVPRNQLSGFAESVLAQYKERSFEIAVGAQDNEMRLALGVRRDLAALANQPVSETTRWFTVLGTPSIRAIFEQAYNLPSSFGRIDIDRQVDILKEKTRALMGSDTVAQFSDSGKLETLTRRFFLIGQFNDVTSASGQGAALSLLQSGQMSLANLRGRR